MYRKNNYDKVTEKEFEDFLIEYPNRLVKNVAGMFDPPLFTYNDFTLGNWPDSVVAFCYDDYLINKKLVDFHVIKSAILISRRQCKIAVK